MVPATWICSPQDHQDGWRLEVVADGLLLFHGALAIDSGVTSES